MPNIDRRHFLGVLTGASVLYWMPGAFAEQLTLTPRLTEGRSIRTNFRSTWITTY